MKIAAWLQQHLNDGRKRVASKKNLKKEIKSLADDQIKRAAASSSARSFFCLESSSDSPKILARALMLTAVLGCWHKDLDPVRKSIVELWLQGPESPEETWEAACRIAEENLGFATGYGCENFFDYQKHRPLGFINSKEFQDNFSPWTLKLRDSRAYAPGGHCLPARPGTEASVNPPCIGVATSIYGYYTKQHTKNNSGKITNYFLNLQIRIDGRDYPLQALLSLQVYPDWTRQALRLAPELAALSEALIQKIGKSPRFDNYFRTGPDGKTRLLVDQLGADGEEIEITPVSSVQLLEDYQSALQKIGWDYTIVSRQEHRRMIVGDGNAINVGIFASNRRGAIMHLGQSDNFRLRPSIQIRINKLFNDKVLSGAEIRAHPKAKHPNETDYRYKQRKHKSFRHATDRYTRFCKDLRDEIKDEIRERQYGNEEGFLSHFNTEPKKQAMLAALLHGLDKEVFVQMLSNSIYSNLCSELADIGKPEMYEDLNTISEMVWREVR